MQTAGANSHATSHPNLKIKSANYECEQRANNTRAAFEQRAKCARAAFEQRANSVRELARTTRELRARTADSGELTRELRGAPVSRLARGSPRLSMPHSYSALLVNNKIKVQMGVSSALFLFLCVNWFTACVGGRRLLLLLLLLRMAGRPWCRLLPHCTAQTITRIVLAAWKMMSHHQAAQNPATLRPLRRPSAAAPPATPPCRTSSTAGRAACCAPGRAWS